MKTVLVSLAILCVGVFPACSDEGSSYAFTSMSGNLPTLDPALVDPALVSAAAYAQRAFSVALYRQLQADAPGENLVVSPFSVFSAFNLLYPGARGDAAQLMRTGFFLEGTDDEILDGQGALYLSINGRSTADARIESANALFVGEQFNLLHPYLDAVTMAYAAVTYVVDFINNYEAVRKDINGWVSDHTAGKIRDLFPAGLITKDTDMVLVNAVYFNAKWKQEFDDGEPMTFHGRTRDTPFTSMYQRQEGSSYGEGPIEGVADSLVQVLPLPYKGENFDMVVMLPSDFDAFVASLTAESLARYLEMGYTPPVGSEQVAYVDLPAFVIRSKSIMNQVLSGMGLGGLFCGASPDFSGLWGGVTCIGSVVHEAYVDVNKKGTEAAAATGIAMNDTGNVDTPRYIFFTADRPFVYAIVDRATRTVLFLGHVVNL